MYSDAACWAVICHEISILFWTCKPVLRCRLSKAHIWLGKPQGGRDLGLGREWGGDGNGEISLRATWDQGGWDPITARRFQVSKGKQKGMEEGSRSKGIAPRYVVHSYACT